MSTIDLVLVNEDENCLDVLERQNYIFSLRDLTRIENIVCTALQLIWTLLFQMLHVIMCVDIKECLVGQFINSKCSITFI